MGCDYWEGAPCVFEDRGNLKHCLGCLQILKASILHRDAMSGRNNMSLYQFIQRLHLINSHEDSMKRSFALYINGEPVTFENFDELVKVYKTPQARGARSMMVACLIGYDGGPDSSFSMELKEWQRMADKIDYVDPLSTKKKEGFLPDYY